MKMLSFMLGLMIVLSVLVLGCTAKTPTATFTTPPKTTVGNDVNTPGAPVSDSNTTLNTLSNVISTGYYGKILAGNITPYIEFNTEDYEKASRVRDEINRRNKK